MNATELEEIRRRPPAIPSPLSQPDELPHDLFAVVSNERVVFGRTLETTHQAQALMTVAAERRARRIARQKQSHVRLLLWNGGATIRFGNTITHYRVMRLVSVSNVGGKLTYKVVSP